MVEVKFASKFLNLPNEELIVAQRQHILTIVPVIFLSVFGFIVISIFGTIIFSRFEGGRLWVVAFNLINLSFWIHLVIKSFIDRFFHLYIVSTRRILEIYCSPLFWEQIDDVFLDQVRTTEIDVSIPSFIHEIMDIGNVTISFDRPSHDRSFVLPNVGNPRGIGQLLSQKLEVTMESSPVWFKKDKTNRILSSEDVPTLTRPGGAPL